MGPKKARRAQRRPVIETDSESDDNQRSYFANEVKTVCLSESGSSSDEEPLPKQEINNVRVPAPVENEAPQVSEYFDFTSIIQTQELITKIKAGPKETEGAPAPKRPRTADKEEQLDISALLEIGEKGADDNEKKTRRKRGAKETKPEPESEPEEEEPEVGPIEVTIPLPNCAPAKKGKTSSLEAALKRRLNAVRKENQVYVHKVHLLCLISHGNMVNQVLNSHNLLSFALSIIPSQNFYPPQRAGVEYLEKLVAWFCKKVEVKKNGQYETDDLEERLVSQFGSKEALSENDRVLMFITVLRALGLKARFMWSLQPLPLRPPAFDEKVKGLKPEQDNGKKPKKEQAEERSPEPSCSKASPKKSKANGNKPEPSSSKKGSSRRASKTKASTTPVKGKQTADRTTPQKKEIVRKLDRRVLSSESDNEGKQTKGQLKKTDFWVEVFLEAEEAWISVSVQLNKSRTTHPMVYVLGWNNDGSIKDLTMRYAPQWMTATRKLRIEVEWWDEALLPWKPKNTAIEREENQELNKMLQDKPLPGSVAEFKNHPLYVLQRHLLKFEAIYPPDAIPMGYIKGEPIYSRLCVFTLHSRETWMRQAKVVRLGEEPYKVVKARPKYDKMTGNVVNNLPLNLFGHWQTEDYIPPPAVDGKVPRNEYGNVELYKPSMLPAGTVHLEIPGLCRVARKLNIDCAPAVTGWQYHAGGSHPILDGFVVCEEFKDVLLDAWNKDIDESAKKSREKIEQRVYGNWKKLIRGLLIKERLRIKYNFGPVPPPQEDKKKKKKTSEKRNKQK